MKKTSVALIILLVVFFGLSTAAKHHKYHVLADFDFVTEIDCDPESDTCFIADCDPETDDECEHYPYAYLYASASEFDTCNPYDGEDCADYQCTDEMTECEVTYCSLDELSEGEICTNE